MARGKWKKNIQRLILGEVAKIRSKMFGLIDGYVWNKGTDSYEGTKLPNDVVKKLQEAVCDAFANYIYSELR